jgi:hypothetical protein
MYEENAHRGPPGFSITDFDGIHVDDRKDPVIL